MCEGKRAKAGRKKEKVKEKEGRVGGIRTKKKQEDREVWGEGREF